MNCGPKTVPAPTPSPWRRRARSRLPVIGLLCDTVGLSHSRENRPTAVKPPGGVGGHPVTDWASDCTMCSTVNLDSRWKERWQTRTPEITAAKPPMSRPLSTRPTPMA